MTLAMSGGWTSDITEMTLPYSVRQAIDDTHLGDTMIRWVPSKKIEHGTMAIRFWHDPARKLPITGDPEMMVITYPDGVNHLTVVGFVEKIGKESIKVGELMQTDALVRVIEYPKAESISNGSFPMLTGALTGKVVTDIIETATLRYLVDTTPASPTDVATIKATIPGASADIDHQTNGYIRTLSAKVFGRRGFCASIAENNANYTNTSHLSPEITITDFTFAFVFRLGPQKGAAFSYNDVLKISLSNGLQHTGLSTNHSYGGLKRENFSIYVGTQEIYNSYSAGTGAGGSEIGLVVLCRRASNVTRLIVNNVETACTQRTINPAANTIIASSNDGMNDFNHSIRDWAFWSSALSDSDFSTLNDQLCAEYGIT